MVVILYDGPDALVTDRVLVIRTRPPQTLWMSGIDRPHVVSQPLSPAQASLIHVLGVAALLILAIWPATRRAEAFVVGAVIMAVAALALAALHRRRPRHYTLCCVYRDECIELLSGTNRSELARIARAILDVTGDSPSLDTTDPGT